LDRWEKCFAGSGSVVSSSGAECSWTNLPDGSVYVGTWKNGLKSGKGILKLPNGDVYDGNFEEDLYDGFGCLSFAFGMNYFLPIYIQNLHFF
jgi:hypothetical protein